MSVPPSSAASQPVPPGPQLLKAEDLQRLRCLTEDQKQKYRPVLQNFWQMVSTKPQGSQEHTQARAKLTEWSQKLIAQERTFRAKQQQLQNQGHPGQNPGQNPISNQNSVSSSMQAIGPTPQTSSDQKPAPPSQIQLPQQTMGLPQTNLPQQMQGLAQPPPGNAQALNPDIKKHVDNFPYRLDPRLVPGSQEAEKSYRDMKTGYLMALMKQEKSTNRSRLLKGKQNQLQQAGQEVPVELQNQLLQEDRDFQAAKKFVEEFRKKQGDWRTQALPVYVPGQQQQLQGQTSQNLPQTQPQQSQVQAQAQPPAQNVAQNIIKQEPGIKVEGGQPPQQVQQFSNMQSGQQSQQSQQPQQNVQVPAHSVNQMPPRPPPQQQQQQQQQQQGHQFNSGQQQQIQQQHQHHQQHQPQRPQINPQQANAHVQHQQNNSPHPQSATSVGPGGPPVPLTHHAAVTAAQRSYSNPDGQRTNTPLQPGSGNNFHVPGSREREQLNNPKLPIPRNLNTATPVPVHMGQARPTLAGPTNGAPGAMGQPVINKFPPFQLEGEGDRVLSKRKLDELVRQVTGGSEDALTPEVEEAMLSLADEFVDSVITSACKLSKLRESSNLEIRDLQLVLERSYNIRIPGYASDEVRTVRKLIPAPGWTQKMNAVQAAKVMGGKTDI